MAVPDTIALAAAAGVAGLESVLVGGNAVNLYGYRRTTFDVDLLVRERESQQWLTFFEQHGYAVFHRSANFIRLHFADNPARALPLDLMLVDDDTFRKVRAESRRCTISPEVELVIPSPLHLVAMKLHALKTEARVERGADFEDVIHLIKAAGIDVQSREFGDVLEHYATEAIRTRILVELGRE